MADLDPCTALRAADQAYFDIMTNGAVRSVTDQNGERIEYGTANLAALKAYIAQMAGLCPSYRPIALAGGCVKPMRFMF